MLTKVKIDGFNWGATIVDKEGNIIDSWSQHNLIPSEGISHLIRSPFNDVPSISNFYCGVLKGNYIPTAATKASDIPNIEYVNYQEDTRPQWLKSFNGNNNSYSNEASPAIFTFTEDVTFNGIFLISSDIKGSANGVLLSIVRFNTPKQITAGTELKMTAALSYLSATTL